MLGCLENSLFLTSVTKNNIFLQHLPVIDGRKYKRKCNRTIPFFLLRYCSRPETAGGRMDRYVQERSLYRLSPPKSYFFTVYPKCYT